MNWTPALFVLALTLPFAAAEAQTAPKFNQWYLEGCGSNGIGNAYVYAGYEQTCVISVKVTPNGAVPVRAVFSYELEWVQGGRAQKLALSSKDIWTPHGGGSVYLDVSNYSYWIAVPINVRARADRQYTAINVVGNLTFSNGSTKKIFEKIPVVR